METAIVFPSRKIGLFFFAHERLHLPQSAWPFGYERPFLLFRGRRHGRPKVIVSHNPFPPMLPSVYLLMESSMYLGTVELESWSLLAWVKSPVVLPNPACEAD